MSKLSPRERDELRKLLAQLRYEALADLKASDPDGEQRIAARKRKVAIGRLKIEKDVMELDRLQAEQEAITKKIEAVESRITKKMPLERTHRSYSCPSRMSMCDAISEQMDIVHEQVSRKDAYGKAALRIEREYQGRLRCLSTCASREEVADYLSLEPVA